MGIHDEIKRNFLRLSRGQRKVAQFVMDNPMALTTQTASDVGKLIGVSESTVIRFCYAMGYSGYGDIQRKIKEDLLINQKKDKNKLTLSKKDEQLVSEVMNRDVKNILNSIPLINKEHFQQTIKWMHELNTIFVLGFRESSPTASFLTSSLKSLRTYVEQIEPDVENIIQNINSMDENSLLFVICLEAVQEDILAIVEKAKNNKAKIVAITTSTLTPLREYVDVKFTISKAKQASVGLQTVICSLIQALVEGMIAQNERQYVAFQKMNTKIEKNILETVKM